MSRLRLSIACWDYDRVATLISGEVVPAGIDPTWITLPPGDTFWRQTQRMEFDVSEMSLSGLIMRIAKGDDRLVAIPVFPSRVFRHAHLFIRTGSGVARVQDLAGHRMAVPEYHMTAALFGRGLLSDEFGLKASDVEWVQAGQYTPGRREREELDLSPSIRLVRDSTQTIEGMLADGLVDGAVTPYTPRGLSGETPTVRRVYADPATASMEYFARTGIFPIMHVIAIRRSLLEREPWIAENLMVAFEEAKAACYRRLEGLGGHSLVSLPLFIERLDEVRQVFGEDFWPYGIEPNLPTLNAATRYSYEQGLAKRVVEPSELFAPSVQSWRFHD